jgi:hypothetical protein
MVKTESLQTNFHQDGADGRCSLIPNPLGLNPLIFLNRTCSRYPMFYGTLPNRFKIVRWGLRTIVKSAVAQPKRIDGGEPG